MTRGGRALLGATLGAALTLLIHPASRPYLFSAFVSPSRHSNEERIGVPNNLAELSKWMLAAGDRFMFRKPLSKSELENAILAAQKGATLEHDNAFWRQMLACFYHQLDREPEAERQWILASACSRWSDHQSTELLRQRERFARDFGALQSWQLAYVYFQRNENAVLLISAYSRNLLARAPLDTNEGLKLRAANIINGHLLREGSQSIRVGDYGDEIAEVACHPPNVNAAMSRQKLFLARVTMHNKLQEIGEAFLADQVNHIYRESDAWRVYENAEEAAAEAEQVSVLSLIFVGFPSMLVVVAGIGGLLWLTGHSLRKLERIHVAPALIAGILLGFGAYTITFLPLAGISAFLCTIFLTLGPKRERKVKIDDLGPMFSFTAGTLALVFMMLLGAFVIGTSTPAVSLLPNLDVPHEYFGGSGVFLGLAIIVLAILLLLAPMFAIALRIGTAFVLSMALKKFGAFLGYTSLASIVIGTPLCIYLDRDNSETLQQIVTNEPVYYLSQPR